MKALENENRNDEQQDRNNKKIKFATGLVRNRFAKIDILGALQSFRRQLKGPGEDQRDWETENNQQDYRACNRIGEMQRRNYGRGNLHHEPSNDRVSDGHFVNIASLQLSEKVLRVHSARLDEAFVTGRTLR